PFAPMSSRSQSRTVARGEKWRRATSRPRKRKRSASRAAAGLASNDMIASRPPRHHGAFAGKTEGAAAKAAPVGLRAGAGRETAYALPRSRTRSRSGRRSSSFAGRPATGVSRTTGRPWRVRTTSSPASARRTRSVRRALASLIGTFIARELLATPAAPEILIFTLARIKPAGRHWALRGVILGGPEAQLR